LLLRIAGSKIDKRLKQLLKEHGNIWRFIRYSPNISCLDVPGYYAESLDGSHERWIEQKFVEELKDVD